MHFRCFVSIVPPAPLQLYYFRFLLGLAGVGGVATCFTSALLLPLPLRVGGVATCSPSALVLPLPVGGVGLGGMATRRMSKMRALGSSFPGGVASVGAPCVAKPQSFSVSCRAPL